MGFTPRCLTSGPPKISSPLWVILISSLSLFVESNWYLKLLSHHRALSPWSLFMGKVHISTLTRHWVMDGDPRWELIMEMFHHAEYVEKNNPPLYLVMGQRKLYYMTLSCFMWSTEICNLSCYLVYCMLVYVHEQKLAASCNVCKLYTSPLCQQLGKLMTT